MKSNILVTGCGGDIGQSVGKILNESDFVDTLYGCDISDRNAAKFIFSNFFVGLPCNHKDYIVNLEKIIEEKKIDIIIPISEPELRFFSENNYKDKIGRAKILIASSESLSVGFDKLATANFLEKHLMPFPKTEVLSQLVSPAFPVIIKSRTGSGSKAIHKVNNKEDFSFLVKKHPDFIAQEYVSDSLGEFTCGLYRSKKGLIRTIILKRELTGGYSGYGEVIRNKTITELLHKLAEKLNLIGSINVQLRMRENDPVVFEINPRLSSTVLFRYLFGFKDLEWSIQDLLEYEIGHYAEVKEGRKFYKGFNEFID
jgi:carbamoyl-phosphate synthase large subunit